ncbi:endonuclease/exonuclease/phosphatase family protein [Runella salmonicolor]|uniref:Endonuclease/exonuclease/phosphatase family protein n=1 Tax=Runella salmonicolor TaxID=2950278 RepID=A0ABT1FN31_9BACT|nr:endonuclease/exonuclease/phosphatase family protein [Runella salmonicolor]MCP1383168.1 endonuclease/exonuclease/phosphatase family protein [Runella salmonicolor]
MQEIRFLFWNLNRNRPFEEIVNIVEHHQIDVLIMAEVSFNLAHLTVELANKKQNFFYNPISKCEKVKILTRFKDKFITPAFASKRYRIDILELPSLEKILLASVHVPDKSHNTLDDQEQFCRDFVQEIKREETEKGILKTILVGDFNMNPFETAMIKSTGLHAVSSSKVSEKLTRTVQEKDYKFFYNPMWSWLGDIKSDVAGSYYYNTSNHINYFWNTFDQVLIRPELIPNFDKEALQILDKDGVKSLLTASGFPDKTYSDHLPLYFTLKLNLL